MCIHKNTHTDILKDGSACRFFQAAPDGRQVSRASVYVTSLIIVPRVFVRTSLEAIDSIRFRNISMNVRKY